MRQDPQDSNIPNQAPEKYSGNINLRYNALFHNTLDGILLYDYIKDEIIYVNDVAIKLLGYKDKSEFIGSAKIDFIPKYSDYFPDTDLHEYIDDNAKRIIAGESFQTKGIFSKKDGTHILVKANVVPTFYKKGEGFTIFQDVTRSVLAHKAKKKIEKRYKNIFDNSIESIIYIDPKGFKPLICNDNALKLLKVSNLEELASYCHHELTHPVASLNTLDLKRLAAQVNIAIETGKCQFYAWLKRKDNELRRLNVVMISDVSDEEEQMLILFVRDVTSFYEYRENLVAKNEELEKYINSNLQLENFAYLASHDLQTPLRSMISFTQLLDHRLKDKSDKKEKELMSQIVGAGKKMKELITNLLAFSTIDKQKLKINRLNLIDIIDNLKYELAPIIKATKAKIKYSKLPKIIRGDGSKINRLFYHIILNAFKFRKPHVTPKIDISCQEKSTHWQFSISDNGIGIEEQYIDKIFGMFKRLHTDEAYQGTGIGLTLAKKIAEQHKGRLWAESDFGVGSTFHFTILKDVPHVTGAE